MRLIDADALIEEVLALPNCQNGFSDTYDKSCIIDVVNEQPIIEERKHGKWIYNPKDALEMMFNLPKCSECGHESSDALNYCPNCGSRMEG